METTVKERLMTFISYLGIGQGKFEKKVGLSNGYLSQLRHSPSATKLQKIIDAFPDLNESWLLTGEGEMLKGGVTQTSHGDNSPNVLGNGNRVSVPPADDTARMQEKIKYLENMVAEKERIISEKERIIRLYEKMEEGRK